MKAKDLHKYKTLDITELSGSPWNTAEKVLGLDENDKVVMAEPEEAVTPEYVENAIDQAMEAETARTESTYLKEHQSLDDYYTKEEVDQAIEDVEVDLSNYYTKEEVDQAIADVDVSDQLVNYALKTGVTQDIASATAYTMDQVEAKGYVTEQDLGDYAKTTAVTQDIQTAMAAETARTEDTYMKIGDVPSLDGYWTSAQTESAITQSIAAETARTENTYAKPGDIPSLTGYATEAYVDSAVTASTAATTGWVESQGYLTEHQDISGKLDVSTFNTYTGATATVLDGKADVSDIPDVSGFVTSGDVATQIGTAMAAETARTESTYLKEHQDISGKLDKTDFNTYTGATETALEGKVDLATYTAYTGSTATAIAAKQDTLESGTNIKTINNQSLLGSGNIDIQGGGGGGSVVELTKAQYEALDPPAQDTTYIITDAETVDLNDYAMASGLTELSGTVATINSNYATKQNVTARASNSNYLPGWNAQGVITGSTAYYSKSQGINGTNYNVFSNSNTNHPAIFAPTSAGTAGQPLLSNGSGAPVWASVKFAFVSQSQYDALTTKDSSTIYFVIDPN